MSGFHLVEEWERATFGQNRKVPPDSTIITETMRYTSTKIAQFTTAQLEDE